jgi:two-component system cell cycle response regulator
MPDMSGLEVCRRLKADPETADIPVILVTALADRASKMAGLEAGADDFLTKPVDEVTLLARVRSLLRAATRCANCANAASQRGHGLRRGHGGLRSPERPGRIWLVAPGPKGAVVWKTALDDQVGGEVRVVPREIALTDIGPDDGEGGRCLRDLRRSGAAQRRACAFCPTCARVPRRATPRR